MHLSEAELETLIGNASRQVKIGGIYAHYKKPENLYTVIDLAILTETNEVGVVYRAECRKRLLLVRPLPIWLQQAEVGGKQVARFTSQKEPRVDSRSHLNP